MPRRNWRAADAARASRRTATHAALHSGRPLLVEAGHGRLYVSGIHAHLMAALPGAALNEDERRYELSLTLNTLRAIRERLGWSGAQLAACCTEDVMRWARAAGEGDRSVAELHKKLSAGWRAPLPWLDTRAGTPAPPRVSRTLPDGTPQVDEAGNWIYRAPFEAQQVMASAASFLDGSAFLCSVGTGKTRAAVEAARHHLAEGHVDVVFVCCRNRGMSTWQREVPMWAPDLRPVVLEGSTRERGETIRRLHTTKGAMFVLNHEVLIRLKAFLLATAKRVRIGFIIDEAHEFKNPQAQRTKAAMEIARVSSWRLIMTGTPVLQGVQDVWSQWYVVDVGTEFGANFVQFRREHLNEDPYSFDITPRDGSPINIGMRMRKRGVRFRKEDCMDLPPRLYETLEVEMTAEQLRAYDEMATMLIARLRAQDAGEEPPVSFPGDGDDDAWSDGAWIAPDEPVDGSERPRQRVATAANQLAMILRLSQITSGFLPDEEGAFHDFDPNPKMDALEEFVRENIREQAIIVWARYRRDIEAICRRLREFNPVHIYGGMRRQDSDRSERMFQEGESRLFVANPHAAGDSITLTAASMAVYYSQDYSLKHRLQSEGRCHRAGSEIHNHVTYVDLICRGTVDEIVRDALNGKLALADVVVDLREHLETR